MDRFGPLILLVLAGCPSDIEFTSLRPELAVLPESVDFGPIVVDEETGEAEVYVTNNGLALLVADLAFEGADAGAFTATQTHVELEREGALTVPLTFVPGELRDYAVDLVVTSNDPEQQVWVVPVIGTGRVPYAPDIEVRPGNPVDLGSVPQGETETGFFEILNVGDADLILGSVIQSGAGTFTLTSDPSGSTIAPNQSRAVLVDYLSIQDQGDSGELLVPSNDPDEPEITVELIANGGGVFAYPEAIIDCPGTVEIAGPVVVTLDGSASTDPSARPLTYAWATVRRPAGADPLSAPDPVDGPITDVLIDAAGTWEVTLQITNDLGDPSVPTKCVIEAVPIDDIHVELSWNGPTADMDLHLAQDGVDFYTTPGEANWCNPNPDWGTPGDGADDPSLDLDDSDGYGPENINITVPADGVYLVRVHHFDDGDDGAVTADVSVFTNGTLAWEGSKVLSRNDVWEVGQINWPDGTFGVGGDDPWDAGGIRECR